MHRPDRITTLAQNGPPPEACAVLYPGEVMHQRLFPFGHRFAYSVFSLMVDIDRLAEVDRLSPLLSVNRANIFSFRESDHAERKGETVRDYVDRLFASAGLPERAHRVLLVSYPRLLGYVFNPISVYFCYDRDGALAAMIYAVRNTFGERHTYVAPIMPGDMTEAGVRQTRAKVLHVSPFIGMRARYNFRILPPGKTVRLRIHETENDRPLLAATFSGDAEPLTTATLTASLARFPFMTFKIIAGIHWEAIKLWWKGAVFHRSPKPPETSSFRDQGLVEPGE